MPNKKGLLLVLALAIIFVLISIAAVIYLFSDRTPETEANTAYKLTFSSFMDNVGVLDSVKMSYVLKASNFNLNQHASNGWTPLAKAAALNPDIGTLKILLDYGASTNYTNLDGLTPLMAALMVDQKISYIKFLVENKANINALDFRGVSVLMIACYAAMNTEKVEYLVLRGAQVNYQAKLTGLTPLMVAAYSNRNPDVIFYLLSRGANKKLQSNQGFTAYNLALRNNALNKNTKLLESLRS